jgi:hypothetical protein
MPEGRKTIPKRMEKRLYQEVSSRCPICGEEDVTKLTIHHLEPFARSKEHNPDEMIVLCANCHAKADAGEIPSEELYEAKTGPRVIKFPGVPAVAQTVVGDGNIVAGGNVEVRVVGRRRGRGPRIQGTVCDDPRKIGYLQYLAKRYSQFREWDLHGAEPMKHGFIHAAYKRHIKYAIKTTPLELFGVGVAFLEGRIQGTKLGRILKSRSQPMFSSFEEFDGLGDLEMPLIR